MQLAEILPEQCVFVRSDIASKKKLLQLVSELFVDNKSDLSNTDVFTCLLSRERLGSTGFGHGVALPHGRVSGKLSKPCGLFIKLNKPVDFDAIDEQPVDLVFALLVPESATQDHLELLAQLASLFQDPTFCDQVRNETDPQQIHQLIIQNSTP